MRQLHRGHRGTEPQVHADVPGELVCIDTIYVGKLKGVGKVWQITACNAACSYSVARLLPELSATAVATFLRKVLLPLYRRTGSPLQRVLTHGGSEFKEPSTWRAGTSASVTRAPNRATPGRTALSNDCTAPSCRGTGAFSSDAAGDATNARSLHDLLRAAAASGLSAARSHAGVAFCGAIASMN